MSQGGLGTYSKTSAMLPTRRDRRQIKVIQIKFDSNGNLYINDKILLGTAPDVVVTLVLLKLTDIL